MVSAKKLRDRKEVNKGHWMPLVELTCNNNRAQDTRIDLGGAENEQLRREMAERDEVGEECHVIHPAFER